MYDNLDHVFKCTTCKNGYYVVRNNVCTHEQIESYAFHGTVIISRDTGNENECNDRKC